MRGITQAELAEEMSRRGFRWHPPTVYKVEAGERQIQLGEALELARILGRSVDDMSRPNEDAARRRLDIMESYADVVSAAAGVVSELSTFRPAVQKLRKILEQTSDLDELFAAEEVESMRWHVNSGFTNTLETVRYDAPVSGDYKGIF